MKLLYPRKSRTSIGMLTKVCAICEKRKPTASFYLMSKATGYRHSYCKPCLKVYMNQRYEAHKS